ncbi:snaclec bitiscetin subunit alpha-like [Mya arenaria]|uniref:snaclec bitiscetin subunit alpha-like n=1 Tax=Mya arenaria TaxID=6604 RepID=UPI0022E29BB0|nr:snaclec bitiscetin subunit alpha-like [Mya arenaria]
MSLIANFVVFWTFIQPYSAIIISRTFVKSMTSPEAGQTYVKYTGQGLPTSDATRVSNVIKISYGSHIHCAQECLGKEKCKGFDVVKTQNSDSLCKTYEECETGWTSYGSHCYRLTKSTAKGWSDAEQVCRAEGAHLVSITSGEENDFIRNLHQSDDVAKLLMIWLGLDPAKLQPQWTDGSGIPYSNVGVPQGIEKGACYVLNPSGEWTTEDCMQRRFFICEKN